MWRGCVEGLLGQRPLLKGARNMVVLTFAWPMHCGEPPAVPADFSLHICITGSADD